MGMCGSSVIAGRNDILFFPSHGRKEDELNTEQSNAGQGTILVVDDDSSTRRALRVTLTGMGFTVVEAARGEEALSLARVTWFDAVLAGRGYAGDGRS
jgi:PleD family two-component response regulator